jgi:hypothetical protein
MLFDTKRIRKFVAMKHFLLVLAILFFSTSNSEINAVGLEDPVLNINDKQLELKIYPNPCKADKLTLELGTQQISEYQITNIAGKQIQKETFNYPENKKQILLNNIQNGIYLIRVKSVDKKSVVKKIIVSKQ